MTAAPEAFHRNISRWKLEKLLRLHQLSCCHYWGAVRVRWSKSVRGYSGTIPDPFPYLYNIIFLATSSFVGVRF